MQQTNKRSKNRLPTYECAGAINRINDPSIRSSSSLYQVTAIIRPKFFTSDCICRKAFSISVRKAISTSRSAMVTGDESVLVSILGFCRNHWAIIGRLTNGKPTKNAIISAVAHWPAERFTPGKILDVLVTTFSCDIINGWQRRWAISLCPHQAMNSPYLLAFSTH